MEDEVDGLTGRLWIRFQTITSDYDREEPAAGAAPGKHCGDAGLAQRCQLHKRHKREQPLLRRTSNANCNRTMICATTKKLNRPFCASVASLRYRSWIMENEVDGLIGRLWIRFQTITSEYDREEPAGWRCWRKTLRRRRPGSALPIATSGITCAATSPTNIIGDGTATAP
jgi:hypothetical protein